VVGKQVTISNGYVVLGEE